MYDDECTSHSHPSKKSKKNQGLSCFKGLIFSKVSLMTGIFSNGHSLLCPFRQVYYKNRLSEAADLEN